MSRWENENVEHLDINENPYTILMYDINGKETRDGNLACAKSIKNNETGSTRYFLKYGRNRLFNSNRLTQREVDTTDWKMRKVSKDVYNLYLKFLSSQKEIHLLQAERVL